MAEILKKSNEGNQFLSFFLKNEMFTVNVTYVREIIEYTRITRVPMMQSFIAGVTNVRGNVIPVLDLPARLGIGKSDIDKKSCIITIDTEVDEESMEIGLIVDMVDQVYEVLPSHKMDAPEFGSKIRKEFMQMMAKVDGKFMTLLDIDGILNMDDLSHIQQKYSL